MRPDRLDCPREGVFPLNIGRYRVATPKTMSGKNEGEWFSEKWTSKTRAPKHPHFLIAKQQDSCDKTAGNGGQNMPMLQGPKIGRSLRGKPFTFDSHQPQSHLKQQARSAAAAARPQSHLRQQAQRAAAAGGAPQSPKAAGAKRRGRRRDQGPQRPRALTSAQRPQPTTAPSQAACSSVTAGGGRASFQNTPQTSVAPCPRLRRSRTRRHTWSRTF